MGSCRFSPVNQTISGLVNMGFCLVFTIIGYAAPYWAKIEVGTTNVRYGLWAYCISDDCTSLTDQLETTEIKVARAFGMLGILATVGSMAVATVFLLKRNASMLLIACTIGMVAFVTIMIEFIVTVKELDEGQRGFCFGLTIAGFINGFFGALNFFFAKYCFDHGQPGDNCVN